MDRTDRDPAPGFAPLDGVRVVDFSSNIAGPFATMILAQLGADVIKVEPPHGDDARAWSVHEDGVSLVHRYVNAGKRSVVLDLKTSAGVAAARRLAATADVLLQSMRPGVAERIGIDRATLQAANPGLVYYDLNGFGSGPQGRAMPGYDPLVQAYSGIIAMNGHDGGPPVRCAPSLIDIGTGQWVAMGIMAAVMSARLGHRVAHVETALVDTAFSLVGYQATAAKLTGRRPPRAGSGNPITAPYQCFAARDGDILVAAPSERLWRRLAEAIEAPALLADERFASAPARAANRAALEAALNQVLGRQTVDHWTARLTAAGVPCARVAGLDEAVSGPIAAERATFASLDGVPLVRLPWLVDGAALDWRRPAPELGAHTAEVLGELGYDAARIAEMTAEPTLPDEP